jgi:hypothetical protein
MFTRQILPTEPAALEAFICRRYGDVLIAGGTVDQMRRMVALVKALAAIRRVSFDATIERLTIKALEA